MLDGDSWLRLYKNVDANELTFGAWIFLPNAPVAAFPQSSMSMKTIASTKISGCQADAQGSEGWALFVHEWGTFNQQLRLSWTDAHLACIELYSETAVVPFDKWVHVGFSLSEARDSARLVIDGQIIADNKRNMGSLAKASQRAAISEVSIHKRKVASGAGTLLYGAHMPQPGDPPHVQSHVFYGFLGDMRVLHTSPDDPELLKKLLMSTAEELLSQTLVPASTIVVQVQFKVPLDQSVEAPNMNLSDGQSFAREPDNGKRVKIVPFDEKPKHPWFNINSMATPRDFNYGSGFPTDAPPNPLVPLSTLEPAALRGSWPTEWLYKNGESALIESQRKGDGWAEEVRALCNTPGEATGPELGDMMT